VSVTGRKGSYPLTFADLPLAVTIVLGDAAAGQAGPVAGAASMPSRAARAPGPASSAT